MSILLETVEVVIHQTSSKMRIITKIRIYSSAIEISQINVFFCNNYNWRLGAICVGCFTREFDQYYRFPINMVFAVYLLENAILVLSPSGAFAIS